MGQLESINPFAKIGKVLKDAGGPPIPSPSPAAKAAGPKGDIYLPPDLKRTPAAVDKNGKRIAGQPALASTRKVSR